MRVEIFLCIVSNIKVSESTKQIRWEKNIKSVKVGVKCFELFIGLHYLKAKKTKRVGNKCRVRKVSSQLSNIYNEKLVFRLELEVKYVTVFVIHYA